MREIKFRGKTIMPYKEQEKWIYGYLTDDNYIKSKELEEPILVSEATVGQYTGLHDKNGKEIYEGDIIKSTLILDSGMMLRTNIDVVEWNKEECSFMLDNIRHFNNNLDLEVIGNIHDNQELLEVSQ